MELRNGCDKHKEEITSQIEREEEYYDIEHKVGMLDKSRTTIKNVGEVFVNKILQGDCLDIMKDIDNDTFDIVVSSPPYNIGMNYNTYDDNQTDYVDWQVKVWNEVCRVLKPTGHLFLNSAIKNNPFEVYDIIKQIDWKLQNSIIWNKQLRLTDMLEDTQHQHQVKRYLMNGWEHLFHFTQDGNTEIDLEQSGVPYQPN